MLVTTSVQQSSNTTAPKANKARLQFVLAPDFQLGVASNDVSVMNSSGRKLGSLEAKDVPAFLQMEKGWVPASFKPVTNWKLCYSTVVMDELGFSI
jgi:hypothetical protein